MRGGIEEVAEALGDFCEAPVEAFLDVADGGGLRGGIEEVAEALGNLGEASVQALLDGLDRGDMGAGIAEAIDAAGDVLQPAFQPLHRRIHVTAGERRLDRAAEFGDPHFQPLDGLGAVVVFQGTAERRDFVAERVEPVTVGHGPHEVVELGGDALVAILQRAEAGLAGAPLDHGAHGLKVVADGAEQAAVEGLLSGHGVDALGDVEHRAVAFRADAADRRHLLGKRAEVGPQCRHRRAERLLVAAHSERLGAIVDRLLMGGDLADGGGEFGFLVGLPPLGLVGRQAFADLGQPLFDPLDMLDRGR